MDLVDLAIELELDETRFLHSDAAALARTASDGSSRDCVNAGAVLVIGSTRSAYRAWGVRNSSLTARNSMAGIRRNFCVENRTGPNAFKYKDNFFNIFLK